MFTIWLVSHNERERFKNDAQENDACIVLYLQTQGEFINNNRDGVRYKDKKKTLLVLIWIFQKTNTGLLKNKHRVWTKQKKRRKHDSLITVEGSCNFNPNAFTDVLWPSLFVFLAMTSSPCSSGHHHFNSIQCPRPPQHWMN